MSIVPTSGTRASGAQFRSEDPATEFCVRIPGKDSFPRCVRGRHRLRCDSQRSPGSCAASPSSQRTGPSVGPWLIRNLQVLALFGFEAGDFLV